MEPVMARLPGPLSETNLTCFDMQNLPRLPGRLFKRIFKINKMGRPKLVIIPLTLSIITSFTAMIMRF